jgi:hypothetical protein
MDAISLDGDTSESLTITGNLTNTSIGTGSSIMSVLASGGNLTINGNVTAGTADNGGSCDGLEMPSANVTVTINGNITGGSESDGSCYGVDLQNGTLVVTGGGTIAGGTNATTNHGILYNSTSTLDITADVVGNTGYGIYCNTSAGNLDITGNVTGSTGFGIYSLNDVHSIDVDGNVAGGSQHGINTENQIDLTVTGSVTGGNSLAYHGIRMASTSGSLTVGEVIWADGKTSPLKVNLTTCPTITKFTVDGTSYTAGGGGGGQNIFGGIVR